MSKFVISCPVCHRYTEASTGWFAARNIRCVCGNMIDVKADRMTTISCPSCGNHVVYDQAEGTKAKCPVCKSPLVTDNTLKNVAHFRCQTCGCNLQADKSTTSVSCPLCGTINDVQAHIKQNEARESGIPVTISYEGSNSLLVYKHPMTDFVTGSQLIVHESQEAIFFRNGEALDSLPSGRYTLETGVLPVMDKLYPLPVQGQPFHAEVYFVNLTVQMGIKWGTNSKVGLFDPATGIHVELGASGSFNLRVSDARRLLIRLVGTNASLSKNELFHDSGLDMQLGDMSLSLNAAGGYFRTLVMTKVKANLAKIIKGNHISVLELDEHIDVISAELRDAINPDLAKYGLEMTEFYVTNIVTPEEDSNFRRMKEQHAEKYLRVREEEIRKAEAEAAFERKAVEAQTEARLHVINAQGEADVTRIKAQAEAEAYRMKAEVEAHEMKLKGYTYQQETNRQVGLEAMHSAGVNGGAGLSNVAGIAGDVIQLGVGLGAVGSVMGMTHDAMMPMMGQTQGLMKKSSAIWNCNCGQSNIQSNFCPNCGTKKPVPFVWDCTCGQTSIQSNFCPNCGNKRSDNE